MKYMYTYSLSVPSNPCQLLCALTNYNCDFGEWSTVHRFSDNQKHWALTCVMRVGYWKIVMLESAYCCRWFAFIECYCADTSAKTRLVPPNQPGLSSSCSHCRKCYANAKRGESPHTCCVQGQWQWLYSCFSCSLFPLSMLAGKYIAKMVSAEHTTCTIWGALNIFCHSSRWKMRIHPAKREFRHASLRLATTADRTFSRFR